MKAISLLLLVSLTAVYCKKSATTRPVVPPPVAPVDNYKDPAAYGTPFAGVPDTKDIIMYEVNLRAFSAEGNLKGLQNRLDNLKQLGANVIWLMPIYPVGVVKSAGGLGSPYSVKDYNAVNAEYGNLDDLRTVVSEAHKRGMAVILDWVANHTSWDNPWIANKSWYQQDSNGNIISPVGTNWLDVAALNYTNNDMRKAMIRAMKFWVLTANVDGFRYDATDFVPTDFWKQSLDTLKKFNTRKLILLSEGSKKEQFTAGFQINYAFEFYDRLKVIFAGTQAPSTLFTANTNEYNALPAGAFKLRYTTNHDVTSSDGSTVDIYKGKQGALAAFVLAAYMNGIPLLYNGQEVGSPKRIDFFKKDPIDWTANPDMTEEYQKLIAFRKSSEAVKTGELTTYNDRDIIAFEKKQGSEQVLVLVNVRNAEISYTIPAVHQNSGWKNALTGADVTLGNQLNLPAYHYIILKK
ncbi:alpha-amylase [Mucilaginibacter hurinus]|uniref:Alpha-amylase n=2 Tax=Mucilaginibacter hurinus TaxID=2201324 RepID=A0A367GSH0_9SPHI|nr:alpha-amylase [Mucilaginibacter hurinus]